jgi:hypothetical protein
MSITTPMTCPLPTFSSSPGSDCGPNLALNEFKWTWEGAIWRLITYDLARAFQRWEDNNEKSVHISGEHHQKVIKKILSV